MLGCYPPPKEVTQRLTRANTGYFCAGALWDDIPSRGKRMCAFTARVRFPRRRGPAGLREAYSLVTAWSFLRYQQSDLSMEQRLDTVFSQPRPKSTRNPSLGLGCCPPLKNRTQRLTGANKGYDLSMLHLQYSKAKRRAPTGTRHFTFQERNNTFTLH